MIVVRKKRSKIAVPELVSIAPHLVKTGTKENAISDPSNEIKDHKSSDLIGNFSGEASDKTDIFEKELTIRFMESLRITVRKELIRGYLYTTYSNPMKVNQQDKNQPETETSRLAKGLSLPL
jgi:hypothetical protein